MKTKILLLLLLSLLFTACTRGTPTPTDPKVILEKHVGDEFKLIFESNASTGYHWEVVGGLDGKIVELTDQYYQSANEVTLVGAAGVEIWVFRAVGVGQTTITLGYYPPSGSDTEPEKTETFTLKVTVED